MQPTYTIKLNSCESRPAIKAEFREVPQDKLQRAMDFAMRTFREVEITADQTGEIILNFYKDCEWFHPVYNYGDAIDVLSNICYNPEF